MSYAHNFLTALREGTFAGTRQGAHYPGVMVHWLGSAGWLIVEAVAAVSGPLTFVDSMHLLRIPIGLACGLSVVVGYWLLRDLLPPAVAALAALLWAFDPFLIAHSRILGVDALLASLMAVALLAFLVIFQRIEETGEVSWVALVIAGALGAMAVLTKLPAITLVPLFGLLWLRSVVRPGYTRWWRACAILVVWALGAILTWFLLYPAMWVEPVQTLRLLRDGVELGATPHEEGNYFWGRPVAAPNGFFYLVAVSLRLTPWTLIGVLLALVGLFRSQLDRRARFTLLWLLIATVVYLGAMSAAPKKFDRYALPAFPMLDIIGAYGLVLRARSVARRLADSFRQAFVWALTTVALATHILWYHPYELAYYNPALGGGRAAAFALLVGWGEGVELAGDFISEQPDGCYYPVAAWVSFLLKPYVCSDVIKPERALDGKGYTVFYISQLQRGYFKELYTQLKDSGIRSHTIRIHGIDYAHVFALEPQVGSRLDAHFADAIRLLGITHRPGDAGVVLQWQRIAPLTRELSMFVHLLDEEGLLLGQVNLPLATNERSASDWRLRDYTAMDVPLPQQDSSGQCYWLSVGLYDAATFERLELKERRELQGAPDDGDNALVVGPFCK